MVPELTLFDVIAYLQIMIDIQLLDVVVDDDPHVWLVHHEKNYGEYSRVMLGVGVFGPAIYIWSNPMKGKHNQRSPC